MLCRPYIEQRDGGDYIAGTRISFNFAIVKAVRRQEPAIDFASAQASRLDGLSDPAVLDLAAAIGRLLVSHDRRTMLRHFEDRFVKTS